MNPFKLAALWAFPELKKNNVAPPVLGQLVTRCLPIEHLFSGNQKGKFIIGSNLGRMYVAKVVASCALNGDNLLFCEVVRMPNFRRVSKNSCFYTYLPASATLYDLEPCLAS